MFRRAGITPRTSDRRPGPAFRSCPPLPVHPEHAPRARAHWHRSIPWRRAERPVCAWRHPQSGLGPASRPEPSTFPTHGQPAPTAAFRAPPAATLTPRSDPYAQKPGKFPPASIASVPSRPPPARHAVRDQARARHRDRPVAAARNLAALRSISSYTGQSDAALRDRHAPDDATTIGAAGALPGHATAGGGASGAPTMQALTGQLQTGQLQVG